MCLSLAAFNRLSVAQPGAQPGVTVRIEDPRCVGKTFPDYFEALFALVQTDAADVPVITIDGPSSSGKGTLAAEIAGRLGYHYLDSGLLYRAVGWAAQRQGLLPASAADDGDPAVQATIGALVPELQLRFAAQQVWVLGQEVSETLRGEDVGTLASRVSTMPAVRTALTALQLSMRCVPGLVADGRDMGTVIFPDASMKVFLTASAATRADRRHKQLISKGISANILGLRQELEARDERDKSRTVAPLKPAEDALLLDNSHMSIEESVTRVLDEWAHRGAFARH